MIHPMTIADIATVLEIDRSSAGHARFTTPWSERQYRAELERPYAFIDVVRTPPDPTSNGVVLAYCHHWVVGDEVQIMNVVTHPAARRSGHARALLTHALDSRRYPGIGRASLEVRLSNAAAVALYEAFGFRVVGRRPSYYRSGEDALVMNLTLAAEAARA